jgi:fluoride exporter
VVSGESRPASAAVGDPAGDLRDLPVDPDIAGSDRASGGVADPDEPPRRRAPSRWPRLSVGVLLAVFVGGIVGGLARYGIGLAAPAPANEFPWDVFAVNVGGAYALALVLVLVLEVLRPTRYVRPALGTGFMGAFTTFSSLATATDHLLAHARPGLAVGYVVGSVFGGLAAASFGLVTGRAISANHHRRSDIGRSRGSDPEGDCR